VNTKYLKDEKRSQSFLSFLILTITILTSNPRRDMRVLRRRPHQTQASVTIAYRTTTAKPRFRQLSPRVAHHRTPKNGNARSFGLLAFRTPRLPRFTFCATAEIET